MLTAIDSVPIAMSIASFIPVIPSLFAWRSCPQADRHRQLASVTLQRLGFGATVETLIKVTPASQQEIEGLAEGFGENDPSAEEIGEQEAKLELFVEQHGSPHTQAFAQSGRALR